MDKDVDHYMKLPYPVEVVRAGNSYFARVEDLPECTAKADNLEDLWSSVEEAKRKWIADAQRQGKEIPRPRESEEYSGRILIRIPKTLHRDLVRGASKEGVSLNQFILTALARAVGVQK